jgi:hypothetical protein
LIVGELTLHIGGDEGAPVVRADGPAVTLRFDEAGDV